MQLIAQYPIQEHQVLPHIGRSVAGTTLDGDTVYGVLERVEHGHLFLQPIPANYAAVQNAKHKMKTKAWGMGGFGGFGWPLMGLSALWLLPFLFW